jgi:hypothetical protein
VCLICACVSCHVGVTCCAEDMCAEDMCAVCLCACAAKPKCCQIHNNSQQLKKKNEKMSSCFFLLPMLLPSSFPPFLPCRIFYSSYLLQLIFYSSYLLQHLQQFQFIFIFLANCMFFMFFDESLENHILHRHAICHALFLIFIFIFPTIFSNFHHYHYTHS